MHIHRQLNRIRKAGYAALLTLLAPGLVSASTCYDAIDYIKPLQSKPQRALYLLIDQTTPLTKDMRNRITGMLDGWGKAGDLVKVAQFSANMKGRFPQITFNQRTPEMADEKFLFQLRWKDRKDLIACLDKSEQTFKDDMNMAITKAMNGISRKIPKTELLFSLKELSKQIVVKGEAERQVVVLITNGMEHSSTMSFYQRAKLKTLPTQKTIAKVRRAGLIGHWKNTEVYIYGLAMLENEKAYVKPKQLKLLRAFWERYFVEGGAKVKAIGIPELLISSIE